MQKSRLNQEEKREVEKDNPALSKVIERNIRTIIHLRSQAARERSLQERIADAIQDKLSIVDHENSELADLEMETKPEDVLAEIQRLQAIELAERKAL
jgi:hypothetical protein